MDDAVGSAVSEISTAHLQDEDPDAAFDAHYDYLFKQFPDADVVQTFTSRYGSKGYMITTEFE